MKSGFECRGYIRKGARWGTADLILRIKDDRPIHLYVDTNNYGLHLTTLGVASLSGLWQSSYKRGLS